MIRGGAAAWLALAACASSTASARPARHDIVIDGERVFPESLTVSRNGTMWVGSLATGAIYRALPRSDRASLWVPAGVIGKRVMGLLADERRRLVWACTYEAALGSPAPAATTIRALDVATGAVRASYSLQGGCNDLAIASDGTVYATDFSGGGVFRLLPRASSFVPWAAGEALRSADGIAILGKRVCVTGYATGALTCIPVRSNGGAGTPVRIMTDRPLDRPDGIRRIGRDQLLMVEGAGRLDTVKIAGSAAIVRVVRGNIDKGPTAAAAVGSSFLITIGNFAALRSGAAPSPLFIVLAIPKTGP